jgi:hypothetical protein
VLVLPFFDFWNPWHLLEYAVLPACGALAVTEEALHEHGTPQVLTFTMDGWVDDTPTNKLPLPDALTALISQDQHPLWVVPQHGLPKPNMCFRKMVWTYHSPSELVIPSIGTESKCFSSITRACADLTRRNLALVSTDQEQQTHVLFMGRDNSHGTTTTTTATTNY